MGPISGRNALVREESMAQIVCPECGGQAVKTETRFGVRHDCCGLWSWGGAPLVDKATHEARKDAHSEIDQIWKAGKLSRSEVYRRLAIILQLPKEKCHMKQMDASTAVKAKDAASRILGSEWSQ